MTESARQDFRFVSHAPIPFFSCFRDSAFYTIIHWIVNEAIIRLQRSDFLTNRIIDLSARTRRLSPTEAEVWIAVTAQIETDRTTLRGRMVGPKCVLSSTIEVSYPLQSFPRKPLELPKLSARVVIPEPSLWEPACPFEYDLTVELWEHGERCDLRMLKGYRLTANTIV
jgi:hypothetical protein